MDAGIPFDVCNGSEFERDAAFGLFCAWQATTHFGPAQILIAGCLGILNVLADTYGPLGLTSSAIDMLECCRDERALNMRYEGGCMAAATWTARLLLADTRRNNAEASFEHAESILQFAKSDRVTIVPAIPN